MTTIAPTVIPIQHRGNTTRDYTVVIAFGPPVRKLPLDGAGPESTASIRVCVFHGRDLRITEIVLSWMPGACSTGSVAL